MLSVLRTNSSNDNFRNLVVDLDRYLAKRNGDANEFFAQYNKIDSLQNVVVVFHNGKGVGCGAIKAYNTGVFELKRMYVIEAMRGKGVATAMLRELEAWAKELGCHTCILETGSEMSDAIGLYTKNGYTAIANYGQYALVENSRCFEKKL